MPHRDRRSPRWRLHDYRREGLYFLTACTAGRREVFGDVVDGQMRLSPLGEVAAGEWARTLASRPYLVGDVSVVMPNHVHLLVGLLPDGGDHDRDRDHDHDHDHDRRDTMHGVPTGGAATGDDVHRRFGQHLARSVSSVMNGYKAAVTRRARRLGLWPDGVPLWQGRFHDRVVRDAAEADRIRRYVVENPARWPTDRLYPDAPPYPSPRSLPPW